MILFFDTETTGLLPGRIIQLSYLLWNGGDSVKSKNFFFGVDYIEPSATAVHGFTVESLSVLSGGETFSCREDEIFDDFSSADLIVGHNVKFDIGFLIAEFHYSDRVFRYREEFDTMKFFTPIMKLERSSHKGYKYPKVSEMCEFLDVYPYDVTRATGRYFGESALNAHDARFDTAALFLCFREGIKKFENLEEIASKHLQTADTL